MQLRFGNKPENYDANHFVYEIARSEMTLEILQSLHKMATSLSDAGRIESRSIDDLSEPNEIPPLLRSQKINKSFDSEIIETVPEGEQPIKW